MTLEQLSQKMRRDTEVALTVMQQNHIDPGLGPVLKVGHGLSDNGPRPMNPRPIRRAGQERRSGFAA